MSIAESIKKAREKGLKDKQILQEIIKQNPEKGKVFIEAVDKGTSPTEILEEIIRQKKGAEEKKETSAAEPAAVEDEKQRIEEARKRIEAMKKRIEETSKEKPKPVADFKDVDEGQNKGISDRSEPEEVKPEEVKAEEENGRDKKGFKETTFLEQKIREDWIREEERRRELLERVQGREKSAKIEKPFVPSAQKEIIRVVPKKPSIREKLWLRISVFSLVLIFLAGISTFWYWYLVINKHSPLPAPVSECVSDADCPEGLICSAEGVCVSVPASKCVSDADCPEGQICGSEGICKKTAEIPVSLFPIENIRTLTISASEELPSLLKQVVLEWQSQDTFRRIVIKKNNQILSLREIFDALQIRVSENLYQKLSGSFTLFSYSQIEGNRIGFAAEVVDKNGLSNLLTSQESTIKDDFKTFFTLMEEESTFTPYPYFRDADKVRGYTGPNFRFQTLTKKDLGICYLVSDYYFVFAGSWKSMEKTAEALVITGAPVEITKDLKSGDRGYEVELLQTWLKQDRDVYPRGLVTGYFGGLSKQAVTLFQEKYASEILTPQGLSKGTGEVDFYTRIKLNELYGKSGVITPIREITIDLRYGDHGDEVRLLQFWLKKDRRVYPEGIISGWFGYLTKAAVIRFQEKYKEEILVPQGLTRGTGVVDAKTRKKLNELYGQ